VTESLETPSELNKQLGLTENYQHDIDDKTRQCKKCHKAITEIELKVCPVVGADEFARYAK